MERWSPKQEPTRQEQFILKRLEKKRKLFGFLRRHRHELFDDGFQAELESMYRDTGAGADPVPPAQLAKMTITFTGDKWSVTEDGKVVQTGTQKLDPTKKPSHVDAVVIDGGVKGVTMLGIYEIKGDTLKVCFDPEGKERPTSFTAKAGLSAEMKREKKKS